MLKSTHAFNVVKNIQLVALLIDTQNTNVVVYCGRRLLATLLLLMETILVSPVIELTKDSHL